MGNIDEKNQKRIYGIRVVVCILVIFLHTTGYKCFDLSADTLLNKSSRIIIDFVKGEFVDFSVYMFFFLSGFLFFHNIKEDKDEIIKIFLKKWKRRIKTLIIPYCCWNCIWMIFACIISSFPVITGRMENYPQFELSLENVLKGIFIYKYNGVMWYVFYLIVYMLVSPALYFVMRKKERAVLLLLFISAILGPINGTAIAVTIKYYGIFFYISGAFCALHCFDEFMKIRGKAVSYTALLIIGLIYILKYNITITNVYVDLIIKIVLCLSIWCSCELFSDFNFKWYHKCTFFIYAFHGITQQCFNKIFSIILPNSGNLSGIYALINTFGGAAITVSLALILAWYLKNYANRVWMVLNGGR